MHEERLLKMAHDSDVVNTAFSSLIILPNLSCNLNCHYCYEKDKNELTIKNKNTNNKIFNIKSIKRQNNVDNTTKINNNLTKSNLGEYKDDKNNKIKDINLSYDNIIINNKSKINNSYFPRKGKYIYTIDNNGKLL